MKKLYVGTSSFWVWESSWSISIYKQQQQQLASSQKILVSVEQNININYSSIIIIHPLKAHQSWVLTPEKYPVG